MRAHRMVAVVVLLLGSAAILWHEQSLWAEVGPDRLASVRVGEPPLVAPATKKCCKKGLLTKCTGTPCITNPNCPVDFLYAPPSCGAATCEVVEDVNSICSVPARYVSGVFDVCKLTGMMEACTDPANTSRCRFTLQAYTVNYYSCNGGESTCTIQPTDVCP